MVCNMVCEITTHTVTEFNLFMPIIFLCEKLNCPMKKQQYKNIKILNARVQAPILNYIRVNAFL